MLSTITSRGSGGWRSSRKNKREGVVMGLLADNFVLTHISLKCLFTKKWKIEREKDKEILRNENKWTKKKMGLQLCCAM